MPDKKKPVDMTTEEAMEELFPPEAIEELNRIAHRNDQESDE